MPKTKVAMEVIPQWLFLKASLNSTFFGWSICLVAVAGDSAILVASVHVQEEVPGVMGREVQSEQQEEQCP